ncbi:uncharacterized protein LOC116296995 [Actinia tenebrosa]|uniref:Uncharacterized protein LOC116296995 n=1 Tax=Actinia tenebrosa TaxID=6105 RepID=A0A6P8I8J6_ACTTE|nr:uncharacterized protein LOC116296995 [Actinia tenebrosa]
MKIYLIAALFLGALVVAHSFEEDEKVELPEVPEQEEQSDEEINAPPATEGDAQESEDEVAEKRALRNVLSSYSCLQLKKRRYCRHAIIRNLCAATCGICRDSLSRVSCLRIRNLKKCNYAIARLYCRRTCSHCSNVNDPCRKYAVLNQRNRRQSLPRGNARAICDQKGFITRWYRFTGLAGNRMPTSAPPKNRCGTHATGWMVGSYPAIRGQTVVRKVCYHWGKSKCQWNNPIKVKNCGRYYVFYLRPTPVCHLRYCGNA